ncbi:MAG: hypothetical protein H0M93_01100 [Methanophagales archaeon]|nr:hypothetical protein [Methanophagales archaeon]
MVRVRHVTVFIVLAMIGAVLFIAVLDMPAFGDPEAPAHLHVVPRYIEMAYEETGVKNIVAAILISYRAYDTLGELTVIFVGAAAVLSLLWREDE